jgi:hypothetical protein
LALAEEWLGFQQETGVFMQPIITKQDVNTGELRRIQFIYHGQTIVSVSQTIRHKIDARPRPAEVSLGAVNCKSIEQIEALGQALLEAAVIAREWSKVVEEELYLKLSA